MIFNKVGVISAGVQVRQQVQPHSVGRGIPMAA